MSLLNLPNDALIHIFRHLFTSDTLVTSFDGNRLAFSWWSLAITSTRLYSAFTSFLSHYHLNLQTITEPSFTRCDTCNDPIPTRFFIALNMLSQSQIRCLSMPDVCPHVVKSITERVLRSSASTLRSLCFSDCVNMCPTHSAPKSRISPYSKFLAALSALDTLYVDLPSPSLFVPSPISHTSLKTLRLSRVLPSVLNRLIAFLKKSGSALQHLRIATPVQMPHENAQPIDLQIEAPAFCRAPADPLESTIVNALGAFLLENDRSISFLELKRAPLHVSCSSHTYGDCLCPLSTFCTSCTICPSGMENHSCFSRRIVCTATVSTDNPLQKDVYMKSGPVPPDYTSVWYHTGFAAAITSNRGMAPSEVSVEHNTLSCVNSEAVIIAATTSAVLDPTHILPMLGPLPKLRALSFSASDVKSIVRWRKSRLLRAVSSAAPSLETISIVGNWDCCNVSAASTIVCQLIEAAKELRILDVNINFMSHIVTKTDDLYSFLEAVAPSVRMLHINSINCLRSAGKLVRLIPALLQATAMTRQDVRVIAAHVRPWLADRAVEATIEDISSAICICEKFAMVMRQTDVSSLYRWLGAWQMTWERQSSWCVSFDNEFDMV